MNKFKLILILSIIIGGLAIASSLLATHMGVSGTEAPYLTLQPASDERLDSAPKGTFNLYRFPVTTDGRPYTIVVEPVTGRPELYASRYKQDVDELIDILRWWCDDDHCGQASSYDGYQTFTFYAPRGESGYYSWFAVYGDTATQYRVKVVNQVNVVRAATVATPSQPIAPVDSTATLPVNGSLVNWQTSGEVLGFYIYPDQNGNMWYALPYLGTAWKEVKMSDGEWDCMRCSKFYRGKFNVNDPNKDMFIDFKSDDGLEIYINGQRLGDWGGTIGTQLGCVNNGGSCAVNKEVAPINIREYLRSGDNVIAARVYNGYGLGYFNLSLK